MKTHRALIFLSIILLLTPFHVRAKIAQHKADSIAAILNGNVPSGCNSSCSLYTSEHPSLGIANTLFIALLVIVGSIWMYSSYKKRYIIVSGIVVALLIVGSYFAAPLFRHNYQIPDSCPVYIPLSKETANQKEFSKPGSEFESVSEPNHESKQSNDSIIGSNEFKPMTNGEDEFKSERSEFSAAVDSETISQLPTSNREGRNDGLNWMMIYEPLVIFFVLALISIGIKYRWFRGLRGYFLLGGLLYFGFYRGACPCMISGFQNGILLLLGVRIKWESALWFLLLVPATYLFGRLWCGWLCHLGALQEFIFKGEKMALLQGRKTQKLLKMILVSFFVLWIVQMVITKTNIYCTIDPFKSAFNLYAASLTGWVLLGILLLCSVLIYRPFCRTICPVGLVLGWVSYLPGAKKLHKTDACIHCKSCSNQCKYRAMNFENKTTSLNQSDCILCGECIAECKKKSLLIQRKGSQKGTLLLLLLVFMGSTTAKAQWECPSRLGANLKPFGDSNLMWSSEVITSAGYADQQGVGNLMIFGGLDYSTGKSTFYFEGGIKNWARFGETENNTGVLLFGLREAYYKYNGEKQNLTLGLQSMKSDDDYLLNERVAGVNYKASIGNLNLNLLGGSVMKEFARNGTFCTVGYLYNIVGGRERALLGNSLGQTNLAMLTLSYTPGKSITKAEFSSDFDGATHRSALFKLNSIGALSYYEYGSWLSNRPFINGLYLNADIAGITLKPEVLVQTASQNNAIIYSLLGEKQIEWKNGQMSRLFARYSGMYGIDQQAIALNSYSNIFAGEVLRFDALDLPFLQMGVKHSFVKTKTSLKLQYSMQTAESRGFIADDFASKPSLMKELDFSVSKNLGKHFLISSYVGYLSYPSLENNQGNLIYQSKSSPWGKVELRFTF